MRIISQNGVDIPYELSCIFVDENRVCSRCSIYPEAKGLLGTYESNERAIEVFGEINKRYSKLDSGSLVFKMPEE